MKEIIKEFPPGPDKSLKEKYISPEPLSISKSVGNSAKKLGLYDHLIFLRNEGYCIIENVFEDSFVAEIRKR